MAGEAEALEVEDPATEEGLASVALPSGEQVDAAIRAAAEARRGWARTPAVERGELLHAVAARLRERTDELAEVMTLEGGKPLIENSDEVGWTAAAFDYYAEIGRDEGGRVIPSIESTQLSLVVKEPIGAIACIVPWNYPLLLLAWKLAPVLAAGNTAVCKPSELTPLSTLMLAPLFEGFPPGVVNIVAGAGDVGARIVADERIDGVAFTGSVETGKKIAAVCAERIARINLEMGGKDPFIVCSDVAADIQVPAKGGAWAAFLNAGQVCTSAERFYVLDNVAKDFVEASREYAESLIIGDPMDGETDIGPMINAPGREKVERHVGEAVKRGAKVVSGGERWGDRGFYYKPTILTGVEPGTAVMSEETFGPVVPVQEVSSLDEAIEMANSVPFGLGANVYTRDFENMLRCMRGLRAGTVWINDPLTDNDAAPFGGQRGSGIGRELGREGLEAFQESKHVHIDPKVEKKEWWYPYGKGGGGQRVM